ncbi:hypothetical protein BIFDEN_01194 [Bifidobacterium dentium ATCC 27678]|nr:hypothetical protein BIFDEN_01194 [Bifidobacterium dentium ATCC 27678]
MKVLRLNLIDSVRTPFCNIKLNQDSTRLEQKLFQHRSQHSADEDESDEACSHSTRMHTG